MKEAKRCPFTRKSIIGLVPFTTLSLLCARVTFFTFLCKSQAYVIRVFFNKNFYVLKMVDVFIASSF